MNVIRLDDYNIKIGELGQIFPEDVFEKYSQVFVLVDENTESYCLPILYEAMRTDEVQIVKIRSGELFKNLETCSQIWNALLSKNADRKTLLINLGGGVIGDMGGFCASTYKRGIDFLQIPTTLLSMVDSSIGGKLGIDMAMVKNVVGVFNNPIEVLIDPQFLYTLEYRQIMSGMAETFKHALIHDPLLWNVLEGTQAIDVEFVQTTIAPSLLVKKEIIGLDPYEKSVRKSLNFGHTLGHAIETFYLDNGYDLLHGEAVILGMIAELSLSVEKKLLKKSLYQRILNVIEKHYSEIELVSFEVEKLFSYMVNDKKNEFGNVQCTLLEGIGQYKINCPIGKSDLILGLQSLENVYK